MIDFIRGMGISLEFPGNGIHVAFLFFVVRFLLVDEDTYNEFTGDE